MRKIVHCFHASRCYSELGVSGGFGRRNSAVAPESVSAVVDVSGAANTVSERPNPTNCRSMDVYERALLRACRDDLRRLSLRVYAPASSYLALPQSSHCPFPYPSTLHRLGGSMGLSVIVGN